MTATGPALGSPAGGTVATSGRAASVGSVLRAVVLTTLLLPRNALVVLLKAYRLLVSPLYGDVCRYHPSCSRYALEAVQQSGAVVGSALAAGRIARCNPWSKGGVDDPPQLLRPRYRITRFGFVAPVHPQKVDLP